MTIIVYGILNCDTVKKARNWLDTNSVAYAFHDYKKAGVDAAALNRWADMVGWTPLLNRAGTTFRKLADAEKVNIGRTKAIALMIANPSMIKRPVVEGGKSLLVGFSPEEWSLALG